MLRISGEAGKLSSRTCFSTVDSTGPSMQRLWESLRLLVRLEWASCPWHAGEDDPLVCVKVNVLEPSPSCLQLAIATCSPQSSSEEDDDDVELPVSAER